MRKQRAGSTHDSTSKNRNSAEVTLYSDGACAGNPGPGGWAFLLVHQPSGKTLERSGAERHTTNNRMELTAVVEGLKSLKRPTRVHIVTDSAYVKNGMESWMRGWKARNWMRKTAEGLRPVKNVEIWRRLDSLLEIHDASFEHVRGHSGHPENERCDELAVAAYRKLMQGVDPDRLR